MLQVNSTKYELFPQKKSELYDMMHIFILGIYSIILPSIKNSNKSIPLWYGKRISSIKNYG